MSATPHMTVPHTLHDPIPMTLPRLAEKKRAGEANVMVTAYDYPSAQVAQAAGVEAMQLYSLDAGHGAFRASRSSRARGLDRSGAGEGELPLGGRDTGHGQSGRTAGVGGTHG